MEIRKERRAVCVQYPSSFPFYKPPQSKICKILAHYPDCLNPRNISRFMGEDG